MSERKSEKLSTGRVLEPGYRPGREEGCPGQNRLKPRFSDSLRPGRGGWRVERPGSSQLVDREGSSLGGVFFWEALCLRPGTQIEELVWPAPASEDLGKSTGPMLVRSSKTTLGPAPPAHTEAARARPQAYHRARAPTARRSRAHSASPWWPPTPAFPDAHPSTQG